MAAAVFVVPAALVHRPPLTTSSNNTNTSFYPFRNNLCPLFCKSYNNSDAQSLPLSTQKSPSNTTTPLLFTEDFFIAKYNFSPEIASRLASVSATMKKPQNPDLFLSFLKQTGFSISHLERVVRHYPKLLSTCPERSVKPKLKIFLDLGFSAAEVTEIIARNPTLLCCKPERIINSLSVFKRLLGSNDNVVKLIKKCGSLLYADPENTILPNMQFLKSCGVQMEQINSLIYTYSNFFFLSQENMRRCVRKADEMGADRTSKMFIYAASAVSRMSDETLKIKLKSFKDLGFTEDDILRLFSSYPMVITVSTWKIKEVIEVLLETGKYDMSCIIKWPISLMTSVGKRYKPRLQVLKELERKGLISKWPSLSRLCRNTDKSFFEKFVAPYINEVGEDFIAKTAQSGKLGNGTAGLKTTLR